MTRAENPALQRLPPSLFDKAFQGLSFVKQLSKFHPLDAERWRLKVCCGLFVPHLTATIMKMKERESERRERKERAKGERERERERERDRQTDSAKKGTISHQDRM